MVEDGHGPSFANCLSGKSKKPAQPYLKKYSDFQKTQISLSHSPSRPNRGAARDRHERGAGCGGRSSVGTQRGCRAIPSGIVSN
jgi:hypothetical protein